MHILKSLSTKRHNFDLLYKFDYTGLNVNVFHIVEKFGSKYKYVTAIREDGVMLFGIPDDRCADEIFITKRLRNSKIKAYEEFELEDLMIVLRNHNIKVKENAENEQG